LQKAVRAAFEKEARRSVDGPKPLRKIVAGCVFQESNPQRQHLPNAAAFSPIAIGATGEIKGARSQGMDSTVHLGGLLFVQLTRALASQHSVLVIHGFLLL
jgi:cation transporter-like permease